MARPPTEWFLPMPFRPSPPTGPIDPEEAATALYLNDGDIPAAATLMKVDTARLRKLIKKSHLLQSLLQQLEPPS
jgi:hypothetical protein